MVDHDVPRPGRTANIVPRSRKTHRRLSPLFATLVIVGVLAVPRLDLPWAGIAGWGLALIAAVAWLITAVPVRCRKFSYRTERR